MLRKAFRPSYIRPQPLKYKRQYSLFRISPEVYDAIRARRPVVALESTIYTHGFPYPDNAALALSLEAVVRLNGGVPATIGVLNGEARVGLSPDELLELASAAGKPETMKVSRRDLGFITGMVRCSSLPPSPFFLQLLSIDHGVISDVELMSPWRNLKYRYSFSQKDLLFKNSNV